ncbi:ATP-binding protein [Thaumasiovibrio subtropicus]|uniref:ATP/GTP-binding protein n=1 Tax=Thaumasiovibrio subtropicus TaxID=1891207 RepID=UPI000B3609E9|nr:ATP-binding protein [Thaumasiovibrio subtropicus]
MKIAISGTYSTGKTTLTEALALATGVQRTQARTMREILPDAVPGKTLEQCNVYELMNLGLSRLSERVVNEERAGEHYFSDGSCLHEWVYGAARLQTGINPADGNLLLALKRLIGMPFAATHIGYMKAFGDVVKRHAKNTYTHFVHLPVEFDLVADGHRPVSESFRKLSNDLLLSTLQELQIPYIEAGGDLSTRIHTITDHFGIPLKMDPELAIELAVKKVKAEAIEIENHRLAVLNTQQA